MYFKVFSVSKLLVYMRLRYWAPTSRMPMLPLVSVLFPFVSVSLYYLRLYFLGDTSFSCYQYSQVKLSISSNSIIVPSFRTTLCSVLSSGVYLHILCSFVLISKSYSFCCSCEIYYCSLQLLLCYCQDGYSTCNTVSVLLIPLFLITSSRTMLKIMVDKRLSMPKPSFYFEGRRFLLCALSPLLSS